MTAQGLSALIQARHSDKMPNWLMPFLCRIVDEGTKQQWFNYAYDMKSAEFIFYRGRTVWSVGVDEDRKVEMSWHDITKGMKYPISYSYRWVKLLGLSPLMAIGEPIYVRFETVNDPPPDYHWDPPLPEWKYHDPGREGYPMIRKRLLGTTGMKISSVLGGNALEFAVKDAFSLGDYEKAPRWVDEEGEERHYSVLDIFADLRDKA